MHNVVASRDRAPVSCRLPAAVGVDGDIRGEQRTQTFHVAVARRGEEGLRDRVAAFRREWIAWTVGAHVSAGAACELPACGRIASDRGRDLLEVEAEHVM